MTGWGSIDTAVEAMRRGARSFVQKPWDDTTLVEVVRREVDEGQASRRRDARQAREHDEARLIQRALLPSTMPDVAAARSPRAGRRRRASAATATTCSASPTTRVARLDRRRRRQGPAGRAADVEPAGGRARVRDGAGRAARRLRQRQSAALPQHRVRQVRDVLLRRRRHRRRHDRRTPTPGTFRRSWSTPTARVERLAPTGPRARRRAGLDVLDAARCAIGAGDRLVCFTDGITEALSPDGEEFGDDRLVDLIRANRTISADALATTLADTQAAWTGGSAQDDATLIVVAID